MKRFFSFLLSNVVYLWSRIYTYNRSSLIKKKRDFFYTLWLSSFIGSIGKNSRIYYPSKLWGGGQNSIVIGNNTVIQGHCILGCWVKYAGETYTPSIEIGDDCNIGEHTHLSSIIKISIGNGVLTGRYVYIGDNNHGGFNEEEVNIPPIKRVLQSKGEIIIEDNVWIGDKATILSGVRVGKGSIVGANSVVTKDVPPYTVVGGNPARIIKQLEICQNQE